MSVMKKNLFLIVLAVALLSSFQMHAQDNLERQFKNADKTVQLPPPEEYEVFQIGFGHGFPKSTQLSNVCGWKLGLPFVGGKGRVWGLESAIFSSATANIRGMQTSVFANICDRLEGLQAGLVNIINVTGDGLQLGLVNYSKENAFQIGLINILPSGQIPFMPLINFYLVSDFRTYKQNEPATP
jgi:hypothetical protein